MTNGRLPHYASTSSRGVSAVAGLCASLLLAAFTIGTIMGGTMDLLQGVGPLSHGKHQMKVLQSFNHGKTGEACRNPNEVHPKGFPVRHSFPMRGSTMMEHPLYHQLSPPWSTGPFYVSQKRLQAALVLTRQQWSPPHVAVLLVD